MKPSFMIAILAAAVACAAMEGPVARISQTEDRENLWQLARRYESVHRFSTLFPAQDVRRYLGTPEGVEEAIQWCKTSGITKVYLETFRGRYQADRETLVRARDRFREAGFIVCGGVTTTGIGKKTGKYSDTCCYTHKPTQEQLAAIFRFTASLFDVIMIDDFYFTDCDCDECKTAKGNQDWSTYRMALLDRVSEEFVIKPARETNPNVKIIIKYPEWYDRFHERGYDVVRQPELFDITWIGTETRNPDSDQWGRKPQFGAYWLSLWASAFSRGKLGGGWYDPFGTNAHTYCEQGRQTILGLCKESVLFCYGALHRDTGPDNVAAFRREMPEQLALAAFVQGETPRGVGTYKPPHSAAGDDFYIFNFVGMLGIPMTADVKFPADSPSLFLTRHALADPALGEALEAAAGAGKPVLVSTALKDALNAAGRPVPSAPNVSVLAYDPKAKKSYYGVSDSVRELLNMSREKADALRRPLLEPLGIELSAPPRVSLYLYGKRKVVVENFNDSAVEISLKMRGAKGFDRVLVIPREAALEMQMREGALHMTLPARSLTALTAK
ncbi:MAG: hypothetical protein N3D11_12000 [Candidatus Sumerlaeia bacterium]|nr:hypothetical protein [Candidatus Sumerlaeia bacterium]